MNTRQLFVLLLVVSTVTFLDAQTRRTGSTREDQKPAPSSSSRGEERAPAPPSQSQPPRPVHPTPPPQPVNPTPPPRPVNPVPPAPAPVYPAPPPVDPSPGGGVLFDGSPLTVVVETFPVAVPHESVPRWPVVGTELVDRLTDAGNSGYSFEDGEVVPFNDGDADLYSEANLLRVADDCDIQDLGPAKNVKEDLRVAKNGWEISKGVEVQTGHQYAVWLWNGDCVRIFVQEVLDDGVVFDWMPGRSIERTALKGPLFGR